MPSGNITRQDATTRSEAVTAQAYRIYLDLTGGQIDDPERNFRSSTELDFDSHGPATHLDIIADRILEASIDGESLDLNGFDGYRLPLPELADGEHTVKVDALMRYSRSGEGMHRFVDPADNEVYLYTQFEPADARRVFANFEQPDQKATFEFVVDAPQDWVVFSNSTSPQAETIADGIQRWAFSPTPRISTYITAIVAGPYEVSTGEIVSAQGPVPASVVCRRSMAQFLDAERIRQCAQRGFEVFEEAFGIPFAFDSYDQVFVPEFNFGAMENAGCVTLRDEYLFRSRVTARELEARDNTILHELAHMWFGDLVTMKWWDDMWLNESFADWASHFAAERISQRYSDGTNPWASFSSERKNWAYLQDQLSTTHPIAADMSDLDKVEQNFDGITYAKGASVLKLLVSIVGLEQFLAGVRNYFTKHMFANTTLPDLLVELEASSGRDLSWFTGQWLQTTGVSVLKADFDVDDAGCFTRFEVLQSGSGENPTLRTHRLGIGLYSATEAGLERSKYVELDVTGERTEVPELIGTPRSDVVLLNDADLTYAKIRFDDDTRQALVANIAGLTDPLARAVSFAHLWDATRDGEIAPQDHVSLVLAGLPGEKDMAAATTMLNQAAVASSRFMAPELRQEASNRLVTGLARLLKSVQPGSDAQLIVVKNLINAAQSPAAVELIRGWLDGEEVPSDLVVDHAVRWQILISLARLGQVDLARIDAELERDNTITGAEKAAHARAALPEPKTKAATWATATEDPEVPNESHRQMAMGFWQYGQDEVLAPYVDKYFEVITRISNREGHWASAGFATINAVVRWLYPETLIDTSVVQRTEAWLAENTGHLQVTRAVTERADEARRALNCQERSRRG